MTEYIKKHLSFVWVVMSLVIVVADYLTGPEITFPVLFILPVALSTWFSGKWWGVCLSLILPITRLSLLYGTEFSGAFWVILVNNGIRMTVLISLALLIDHLVRSRKKVEMLESFLPICSFCKKIRLQDNTWVNVEAYFTEKNNVKFSHGFCQDCGQKHYGDFYTP